MKRATMKKIALIMLLLSSLSYSSDTEKKLYKSLCESGISSTACNKLARLYYSPKYEKDKDIHKAIKYFNMACDKDEVSACYELSAIYYQGLGTDKSWEKGNKFSIKACKLGSANGCHSVGYMYNTGVGRKEIDKEKAVTYLTKACNNNIKMACLQLTDNYNNKSLKEYNPQKVQKSYKEIRTFYQKSCDKKNSFSCGIAGRMYALGKGTEVNWDKANKYFKKECDYNNNSGGCIHLAYAYLNGSKEKNVTKATALLKEGCQLKFGFACALLGDIYVEKGEKKRANAYYDKAIKGHTDLADGYNVLYDFNKLFEVSLIQNREFDKKLEKKFLKLYKEYDEYLINYKILKLFEAIYHGKEPDVKKFVEQYKNVELQKDQVGYEFPHLKIWIDNMKDKALKKRLTEAFKMIEKEFLGEAGSSLSKEGL